MAAESSALTRAIAAAIARRLEVLPSAGASNQALGTSPHFAAVFIGSIKVTKDDICAALSRLENGTTGSALKAPPRVGLQALASDVLALELVVYCVGSIQREYTRLCQQSGKAASSRKQAYLSRVGASLGQQRDAVASAVIRAGVPQLELSRARAATVDRWSRNAGEGLLLEVGRELPMSPNSSFVSQRSSGAGTGAGAGAGAPGSVRSGSAGRQRDDVAGSSHVSARNAPQHALSSLLPEHSLEMAEVDASFRGALEAVLGATGGHGPGAQGSRGAPSSSSTAPPLNISHIPRPGQGLSAALGAAQPMLGHSVSVLGELQDDLGLEVDGEEDRVLDASLALSVDGEEDEQQHFQGAGGLVGSKRPSNLAKDNDGSSDLDVTRLAGLIQAQVAQQVRDGQGAANGVAGDTSNAGSAGLAALFARAAADQLSMARAELRASAMRVLKEVASRYKAAVTMERAAAARETATEWQARASAMTKSAVEEAVGAYTAQAERAIGALQEARRQDTGRARADTATAVEQAVRDAVRSTSEEAAARLAHERSSLAAECERRVEAARADGEVRLAAALAAAQEIRDKELAQAMAEAQRSLETAKAEWSAKATADTAAAVAAARTAVVDQLAQQAAEAHARALAAAKAEWAVEAEARSKAQADAHARDVQSVREEHSKVLAQLTGALEQAQAEIAEARTALKEAQEAASAAASEYSDRLSSAVSATRAAAVAETESRVRAGMQGAIERARAEGERRAEARLRDRLASELSEAKISSDSAVAVAQAQLTEARAEADHARHEAEVARAEAARVHEEHALRLQRLQEEVQVTAREMVSQAEGRARALAASEVTSRLESFRAELEAGHAEQVRDMQTRHEQDMRKVQGEHETAMAEFRTALVQQADQRAMDAAAVARREGEAAGRTAALALAEGSLHQALATLTAEWQGKLRQAEEAHATALATAATAAAVELDRVQARAAETAAAAQAELESTIVSLQNQLSHAHRQLEDVRAQLATVQDELADVRSQLAQAQHAVVDARAQAGRQLEQLQEQHQHALAQVMQHHEQALKDLQDRHESDVATLSARHESALASERQAVAALTADRDAARVRLEQLGRELQQCKEAAQADEARLHAKLESLGQSLASSESERASLSDRLARDAASWSSQVDGLQRQLQALGQGKDEAVQELRAQLSTSLDEARRLHRELDSSLQDADGLRAQLTRVSEELDEVSQARAQLQAQLQQQEQDHRADLSAAKHAHEGAMEALQESLQSAHSEEVRQLTARHGSEVKTLREGHKAELSSVAAKHAEEMQVVQDKLEQLQRASEDDRAALATRHEDEVGRLRQLLQDEKEQAVAHLTADHRQELRALVDSHSAEIRSLQSRHDALVASLREEVEVLTGETQAAEQAARRAADLGAQDSRTAAEGDMARMLAQHQQEVRALKSSYEGELSSLRAQLEEVHRQLDAASSETTRLQRLHTAAVASLEEAQAQALADKQAWASQQTGLLSQLQEVRARLTDALRSRDGVLAQLTATRAQYSSLRTRARSRAGSLSSLESLDMEELYGRGSGHDGQDDEDDQGSSSGAGASGDGDQALLRQVRALETARDDLAARLRTAEADVKRLRSSLTSAEQSCEEAESALEQAERRAGLAEDRADEAGMALAVQEAEAQQLRASLEARTSEVHDYSRKLSSVEGEHRRALDKVRAELAQAEAGRTSLQQQLDQAQASLSQSRDECDNLHASLDRLREVSSARERELQDRLSSEHAEARALAVRAETATESLARARQDHETAMKRLESEYSSAIHSLEQDVASLSRSRDMAEDDLDRARAGVQQAREAQHKAETRAVELSAQLTSLQTQLSSLRDEVVTKVQTAVGQALAEEGNAWEGQVRAWADGCRAHARTITAAGKDSLAFRSALQAALSEGDNDTGLSILLTGAASALVDAVAGHYGSAVQDLNRRVLELDAAVAAAEQRGRRAGMEEASREAERALSSREHEVREHGYRAAYADGRQAADSEHADVVAMLERQHARAAQDARVDLERQHGVAMEQARVAHAQQMDSLRRGHEDTVAGLQRELAGLKRQLDGMTSRCKKAEGELDMVRQSVRALGRDSRAVASATDVASGRSRASSLDLSTQEARPGLPSGQGYEPFSRYRAGSSAGQNDQALSDLQSRLTAAQVQVAELQSRLRDVQAQLTDKGSEVQSSKAEVALLYDRLGEAVRTIAALQRTCGSSLVPVSILDVSLVHIDQAREQHGAGLRASHGPGEEGYGPSIGGDEYSSSSTFGGTSSPGSGPLARSALVLSTPSTRALIKSAVGSGMASPRSINEGASPLDPQAAGRAALLLLATAVAGLRDTLLSAGPMVQLPPVPATLASTTVLEASMVDARGVHSMGSSSTGTGPGLRVTLVDVAQELLSLRAAAGTVVAALQSQAGGHQNAAIIAR